MRDDQSYDEAAFLMRLARQHQLMSREEEQSLSRRVRAGGPDGNAAKEEFLTRNIRLVAMVAKRYCRASLSHADLIQEGCIGLMKAIEKFDPDLGHKFSTYAIWWIRQAINRAASTSDVIRIPHHVVDERNRVSKALALHGDISDEDLAETACVPTAHIQMLRNLPRVESSTDTLMEDQTIQDTYGAEDEQLSRRLISRDAEIVAEHALAEFSERDRIIFMDSLHDESFQAIGAKHGISRERVRQIVYRVQRTLARQSKKLGAMTAMPKIES